MTVSESPELNSWLTVMPISPVETNHDACHLRRKK